MNVRTSAGNSTGELVGLCLVQHRCAEDSLFCSMCAGMADLPPACAALQGQRQPSPAPQGVPHNGMGDYALSAAQNGTPMCLTAMPPNMLPCNVLTCSTCVSRAPFACCIQSARRRISCIPAAACTKCRNTPEVALICQTGHNSMPCKACYHALPQG